MKKLLYLLVFISAFSFNLRAQDTYVDSLFNNANSLYNDQSYFDAIDQYLAIIDTGYKSMELFYNLGNAYYKNQDYAKAILYYEKALLLSPQDEDVLFNLRKAQAYTIDKIDTIPEFFLISWLRGLISVFSSNMWAIISLIGFLLALALFILFFVHNSRQKKVRSFSLAIFVVVLALLSYIFSVKTKNYIEKSDQAIIMQSTVTVKGSPDLDGINVFIIHEGAKVTTLRTMGDWYEIRIADGKQGWVQQSVVEKI